MSFFLVNVVIAFNAVTPCMSSISVGGIYYNVLSLYSVRSESLNQLHNIWPTLHASYSHDNLHNVSISELQFLNEILNQFVASRDLTRIEQLISCTHWFEGVLDYYPAALSTLFYHLHKEYAVSAKKQLWRSVVFALFNHIYGADVPKHAIPPSAVTIINGYWYRNIDVLRKTVGYMVRHFMSLLDPRNAMLTETRPKPMFLKDPSVQSFIKTLEDHVRNGTTGRNPTRKREVQKLLRNIKDIGALDEPAKIMTIDDYPSLFSHLDNAIEQAFYFKFYSRNDTFAIDIWQTLMRKQFIFAFSDVNATAGLKRASYVKLWNDTLQQYRLFMPLDCYADLARIFIDKFDDRVKCMEIYEWFGVQLSKQDWEDPCVKDTIRALVDYLMEQRGNSSHFDSVMGKICGDVSSMLCTIHHINCKLDNKAHLSEAHVE
eukprot:303448_1